MTQVFSKLRCLAFLIALVCFISLSMLYDDKLNDISHQMIKDMQEGLTLESPKVKGMKLFTKMFLDEVYFGLPLLMVPFVSRERFWYYLVTIQFASFFKVNLKMMTAQPRPVWLWSDLSNIGCAGSFGSPSGQATRSATLAFGVILDLFFASQWSKQKYPQLNKMTPSSNKLAFVLISVVCISFWLANLYDAIFLGEHTLSQIIMGSESGIWVAFFFHFVLRDSIFKHITTLTSKVGELSRSQAIKYSLVGSLVIFASVAFTIINGFVMKSVQTIKQEWMVNQINTCGKKFDVDENGNLVASSYAMFIKSIVRFGCILFVLGLYLGQVMFRYSGAGRLETDSYTKNASVIFKLIYGLILAFIYTIPLFLQNLTSSSGIQPWANATFVIAIPNLIVGYLITYSLPKLTSRACNYPQTLPEVTQTDIDSNDAEKGAEVKRLQIKETLLSETKC